MTRFCTKIVALFCLTVICMSTECYSQWTSGSSSSIENYKALRSIALPVFRYKSKESVILEADGLTDQAKIKITNKLFTETISSNWKLRGSLAKLVDFFLVQALVKTAGIYEREGEAGLNPSEDDMGVINPESIAVMRMSADVRTMIPMNQILMNATNCTTDLILIRQFDEFVGCFVPDPEAVPPLDQPFINAQEFQRHLTDLAWPRWMETVRSSVAADSYLRERYAEHLAFAKASLAETDFEPMHVPFSDDGKVFHQWIRTSASVNLPSVFDISRRFLRSIVHDTVVLESQLTWLFRAVVEEAKRTPESEAEMNAMFQTVTVKCLEIIGLDPKEAAACHLTHFRRHLDELDGEMAKRVREAEKNNAEATSIETENSEKPSIQRKVTDEL